MEVGSRQNIIVLRGHLSRLGSLLSLLLHVLVHDIRGSSSDDGDGDDGSAGKRGVRFFGLKAE